MAYTPTSHAPIECPYCEEMFTPSNKRRTYCYTKACHTAHRTAQRAEYIARHEKRTGVPFYSGPARPPRTTYTRACAYCGATYTTHTKATQYCSATHSTYHRAGYSPATTLAPYVAPPRVRTTTAPTLVVNGEGKYIAAKCIVCNTSFITRSAIENTCSTECKRERKREWRRNSKHTRRARKKNAFVANVYRTKTFERDGYRCHICKAKTNPNAKVPNPKAPTLDHLIPLSKGGTHEPSNVATACFRCNHLKADRGTGDQLLLFG